MSFFFHRIFVTDMNEKKEKMTYIPFKCMQTVCIYEWLKLHIYSSIPFYYDAIVGGLNKWMNEWKCKESK